MGESRGFVRPYRSRLIFIIRVLDASLISLVLAAVVGFFRTPWRSEYTLAAVLAPVLFYFSGSAVGLYKGWRGVPMRREMLRIWLAWGCAQKIETYCLCWPVERGLFQTMIAAAALDMVRRTLLGIDTAPRYFSQRKAG